MLKMLYSNDFIIRTTRPLRNNKEISPQFELITQPKRLAKNCNMFLCEAVFHYAIIYSSVGSPAPTLNTCGVSPSKEISICTSALGISTASTL